MAGSFRSEKDPSVNRRALGVALVTLAIFSSGIVWAYAILKSRTHLILPAGEAIPREVRQSEVGIVIKTLYQTDTRYEDQRSAQEASLHTFGWVDRDRKIIHIPIEQAIDQYLDSVSKSGAPR